MANNYYKKKQNSISEEEKKYQEALELETSVDCVLRFEWKTKSLEDAAEMFRSLGEYKDAKEQAEYCEKEAKEILLCGYEETYQSALLKWEHARKKSEILDAISEFNRVLKSEEHAAEAKEHISACKKKIFRLETKAVWKKRGIALVIICVLLLTFYFSPAYSFTHRQIAKIQGKYHIGRISEKPVHKNN